MDIVQGRNCVNMIGVWIEKIWIGKATKGAIRPPAVYPPLPINDAIRPRICAPLKAPNGRDVRHQGRLNVHFRPPCPFEAGVPTVAGVASHHVGIVQLASKVTMGGAADGGGDVLDIKHVAVGEP